MSKQQLRIPFIALSITGLFAGVLAFTVGHAQLFKARGNNSPVSMLMNSSPVQTTISTGRGPIQNVRFTLYDAGIFPRQLRAKPGAVAIVLEDHTRRRPSVAIERETEGGAVQVSEISFPSDRSRTRVELKLGVGQYQVFDVTNRANRAELIIQP